MFSKMPRIVYSAGRQLRLESKMNSIPIVSRLAVAIASVVIGLAVWLGAQTPAYDLNLRNGRIVDGTGSPWYRGDVAVRGDTIVAIAPKIDAPAGRVIDIGGSVVAPGFIDV